MRPAAGRDPRMTTKVNCHSPLAGSNTPLSVSRPTTLPVTVTSVTPLSCSAGVPTTASMTVMSALTAQDACAFWVRNAVTESRIRSGSVPALRR